MKPYLLIAWDGYYPSGGTDDWIATFETIEDAEACLTRGRSHGLGSYVDIQIGDEHKGRHDFCEIVDLRKWVGGSRKETIKAKLFDEFVQLCTDSSPVDLMTNIGKLCQRGLLIIKNETP